MTAIDQKDLQKMLYAAAAAGDSGMVRKLAMAGADLDARNEDGFTAFNIATMKGHTETAKTILAAREFKYTQALGMSAEAWLARPETRGELAKSIDRKDARKTG